MNDRPSRPVRPVRPGGSAPAGPASAPRGRFRVPAAVRRVLGLRLVRLAGKYAVALACCLVIAGIVLVLTPRRHHGNFPVVHYRSDLAGLLREAPYPVYVPQGLPPTWRPISSRLSGVGAGAGPSGIGGDDQPVSWHLGFASPTDRYVALEQSDERPDGPGGFVIRMTSEGRPEGSQRIAGQTWQRYFRADKKQRSLVRRLPGDTLVITGTAEYAELAVLAGALRPAKPPG